MLLDQIILPVRWTQSIERMMESGVDCFIEIGPGHSLTGFIRKISKEVKAYSIETIENLLEIQEERRHG